MGQHAKFSTNVILVADDEILLRMHAADVLERECYEVVEATNAAEAIRILESRDDIRILFTDIQMPGKLDGLELAQLVHERWPQVLLLVTSARLRLSEEDIPDHGRFLAKPYAPDELLTRLNDLSER